MAVISPIEWDIFLEKHPNSHILQTRAWGEFKADFGWKPVYFQSRDSGAQVLFRKLPLDILLDISQKDP